MTIVQAIFLGFLQGFTEFLPVSSSGHLVLAQELLQISHEGDISFEVFVHFGTLLSVFVAFHRDVVAILSAVMEAIVRPRESGTLYKNNEFFRLGIFIIVGSIPAAIIGLQYEQEAVIFFSDPKLISVMLIITGFILYLTRFARPKEGTSVGLRTSIIIGCAQAVAIIPGISRSGSTISAGLFVGVSRENSAKFSFLMSLPVIFGATILKIFDLVALPPSANRILMLSVSTVVAGISGYVAIRVLFHALRRQIFGWFAYYCLVVGIAGVLFVG